MGGSQLVGHRSANRGHLCRVVLEMNERGKEGRLEGLF